MIDIIGNLFLASLVGAFIIFLIIALIGFAKITYELLFREF